MGIGIFVILIALIFLRGTAYLYFVAGLGVVFGVTPIVFTVMKETRIAAYKEEVFLEFARDLVESVKTGTPISKTIVNLKDKVYGPLSPHIQKLGNQIHLGIPLLSALEIFAKEVGNKTIARSIILIGQAERAGGDIGEILESVAGAVSLSNKLKKERKAAIQTLVTQGYIIFIVFIIIIIVMQFKIVPMVGGISGESSLGGIGLNINSTSIDANEISGAFLYLLLIQGFFTGLTIGKLSEGNMKAGVKHSFTLMLMSFITSTGATIFFG